LARLAILVGLVGLVIGGGVAGSSLYRAWRAPDAFDRTVVGGALSVRLEAGQRVVVYDESSSRHSLDALGLTVSGPTGAQIAVEPYHGLLQYDRGEIVATAVGSFTAQDAGLYQLRATGGGSGALAVGSDLADIAIDGLDRGIQVGLLFLVLAVALGVVGGLSGVRSNEPAGTLGASEPSASR
jgi:hypothetical protein